MHRYLVAATLWAALALSGTPVSAADSDGLIRSSDGGEVRALIVGIDSYRHVRPLKGAVADARDLETALRRMGVRDVVPLINEAADRTSLLHAIDRLVARTRPADLVILTIAGHGAQEPERVKGSQPDGMEDVFLLPDFEPTAAGSQQRVLGKEFNHFIKQLELRGAKVVFVADTCHGGGMVREIDPRAEQMSFRQVPRYTLPVDMLKPVVTEKEEFLNELDFDRTAFLAAVDRRTKSPEVRIPGIEGLRGALSYAVARAIEGGADADKDGKITLKELFTHVRQIVYQLSDQRQNVVTLTSPGRDLNTEVVFQMTRGVSLLEGFGAQVAAPALAAAGSKPVAAPALAATDSKPVAAPPSASGSEQTSRTARPVRIAALDGKRDHFAGLATRETPFEIVSPIDNPDLIWDPASRDVLAWGDVIAYRIDRNDLTSVIDRAAAIRDLKRMATAAPQPIKIAPDDGLHRNESLVKVEVGGVAGRSLVLFNIAGDGTVQLLYPIGSDAAVIETDALTFPVKVKDPFGADQIVAVTSRQRMAALEQAVLQMNRRRSAAQAIKMVQRYAPADARIGSAGLFTAP